jgi:hypothetical protein
LPRKVIGKVSRLSSGLAILALLLSLPSPIPKHDRGALGADAESQSGYSIGSAVMGSAGSPGSSSHYLLNMTMGQPTPIEIGSSSSKILFAGFWGVDWIPTPADKLPTVFRDDLFQNFPNPFNPLTTIEYSVAKSGPVRIVIFDVDGRRIKTLVNENISPGRHRTIWDGRNERGVTVSSGIYFYRIEIGSYISIRKMVVLR